MLAAVFEQLGYGAENATWRNCFLMGARELRHGPVAHTALSGAGLAPAMTVTQIFDTIAIRIDGPKAWDEQLSIEWTSPIVTSTTAWSSPTARSSTGPPRRSATLTSPCH